MTANPVELISGLTDTDNVSKADIVSWAKARVPQTMTDATEVQNTNLAGQVAITLKSTGAFYYLDTSDTTTPHDGVAVLVSLDNKRFKLLTSIIAPSPISLGGVFSLAPITNHFLTGIGTDGTPSHARPSASDLSDGLTGTGAVVRANSPAITTPTGIVKGDVGLGNVDNTSDATKNAATATLTNKTISAASNTISNLTLAMLAANVADTDGTLAANSDSRVATQKATKTYVDSVIAANDAMVFKGVVDCSTNPNYPAADRGWTYRVSVAGKIGGASGVNVEAGDILLCLTDGTAGGDHATVGANWGVIQNNIDGAVTLTGTQTLTNKTLTAPAITTPTGIVKGDVGLGNVDNTSDATKNAATATLTNKTLTAPVINSPTGIVKGDVGLGNVDNTSDATKNAATATLTNKTLTAPAITTPAVSDPTVTGTMDVQGAVKLSGDITPTQITANQNDYAPTGFSGAGVVRLSSDAARDITGLAGGADGRLVILYNAGTQSITLKDGSTSSSAANRFGFGADLVLSAKQGAAIIYDSTASLWRQFAGPAAGAGGGSGTVTSVAAELGLEIVGGGPLTSSGSVRLAPTTIVQDVLAWMGVARAAGVAGYYGMGFADSFGALTYVDTAGATALDTGTAGLLKNTVAAESMISAGTGSNIGNLTESAGGIGLVFNGTTNANAANSGTKYMASAGSTYVGKDYSGSGGKKISKAVTYGSNDYGYLGTNSTVTLTLRGKATSPSSATDGTSLATTSFTDSTTTNSKTLTSSDTTTAWNYVWVEIYSPVTDTHVMAEVEFWTPGSTNNLTVASNSIALASVPATVIPVIRIKHVDTATAGTDYNLYVSRDGGTTYSSAASLTAWVKDPFESGDVYIVYGAPVDVSGQPSGQNLRIQVKTFNAKSLEIRDWGAAAFA